VTTDRAPAYPRVPDELLPAACHVLEKYANVGSGEAAVAADLNPC